jgi:hypothetical protein
MNRVRALPTTPPKAKQQAGKAGRNTEYGIRNTEYGIRNTEYGIRNTEYGIRNTEYGIRNRNTEYGIRNTEYGIRNTEYGIRNTEYGIMNTVVAISIRTSKFRMGLLNDDRLAGQFKLRMDLSWDLEPPLARPTQISDGAHWASPLPAAANSLARSANCRPAHHSSSPTACVRLGRSPARSYQRKPCLQPAHFWIYFLKERFFWNARSV